MNAPLQSPARRGRDALQRPVASALALGKAHDEVIDESHLRCAHIGLEAAELGAIRYALDAAGGNISEAAKRLGVNRNTIYRKLRRNAPHNG